MLEIIKKVYVDNVRSWCIEMNLYTNGTNEEYSKMFTKCVELEGAESEAEFTAMVTDICKDVWEHSDMEEYAESGCTMADFVCGFLNRCITFIVR